MLNKIKTKVLLALGAGALVLLFNISKSLSVASTIIIRVCTLWFAVLAGVLTLFLSQKRFEVAGILDWEVEIVDGR